MRAIEAFSYTLFLRTNRSTVTLALSTISCVKPINIRPENKMKNILYVKNLKQAHFFAYMIPTG